MKLDLPRQDFKAFIFDCDGTIADTMPLHYIAWSQELDSHSCQFSEELFYAWAGMPTLAVVERLNREQGLSMPAQQIALGREKRYLEMLSKVQGVPEVVEQIHLHYGQKLFAVASGGYREAVLKTLQVLGLDNKFDAIVAAEDYTHGKPHPEAFLLAAQKLGVQPKDCLVFEDADLGIDAARAAGMQWVRIASPLERRAKAF